MKNTKSRSIKIASFTIGLSLLLSAFSVFSMPNARAAGTKTWSNTDCTGGTPNCNWSDVNNWIGGVIPVNGDDIVFDNSTLIPANSPTNDINGLAVNSVSFINAGSGANTIVLGSGLLGGDLTVNTAIFQAASATTDNLIKGTMLLGGTVTVTGNNNHLTLGSSSAGQANDILNLNNHALNFVDVVNQGATPKVTVNDIISGSGTVTYNGTHTKFVLNGLNSYSGTTNVTASSSWVGGDVVSQQPFGTSTIVVSSAAGIKFNYTANTSITNAIRLTGGTTTTGLPVSIYFANSGASSMTYTVPNITLLGNVRLSNDSLALVNLTGITANGHCIEYLTAGALVSTPYTGGPGICVTPVAASSSSTPKAPDTGLALVAANPIIGLLTATSALTILVVTIRKLAHRL